MYVAHGPHTNWAERAAADAEAEYRKNLGEGERMPAGLSWTVTKETYTPVPEGEVVEVQREQVAYSSEQDDGRLASPAGDPPDERDDRDDGTAE